MKLNKILIFPLMIFSGILLGGCYSDTIDSLSRFNFQLPIFFEANYWNKTVPDTSREFANLNKYDQYKTNKNKIQKALILDFNYRIDSLLIDDNVPFDSTHHDVVFDNIRFELQFARLKAGLDPGTIDNNYDPVNYEPDPNEPPYLLGEFTDVDVADYFRKAHHIKQVDDAVSQVISDAVKNRPAFYIFTYYSPTKGQIPGEKRRFPYISAKFDLIIKFQVNL